MKRIGLYVVVLMYLLTMCSNDIVTVERARVDWGNDDYVGNNQVWDFSSVPVLDSNVRLVTDLSGNVIELNNYYPYGSLFSENDIEQPYKYSGKEFENRNGLNIYDFHARYFDYAIPCFTTQDPLQEKYYQISPYTYCSGDPINKIDPSGKYVESVWDAVNIGLGISSLWSNIQDGNVADAVVDGLGIAVDVVAIILPGVPGGAGTAIKSIRVADNVVDAAKISKNVPKFNSKSSTTSKTSNEALRKAKDQNGIPRSQQPDKTIKVGTPEGDDANLKANENIQLYEYTNSNGERIQIRQDKAKIYKDGGTQLPHYNAGKKDEKLKQHHNYGN